MKSFQAVIIAALAVSAAAINEPVASPTAAIERELAEYERQLGTDVSPAPSRGGDRPGVSYNISVAILNYVSCCWRPLLGRTGGSHHDSRPL